MVLSTPAAHDPSTQAVPFCLQRNATDVCSSQVSKHNVPEVLWLVHSFVSFPKGCSW